MMTRLFSKAEQASVFMSAMLVMTKHNIPIAPADEFAEGVEMLCSAMCDMLSVMHIMASAPVAASGLPIRSGLSEAREKDLLLREIDAHRDMKIALSKMGRLEPWIGISDGLLSCGYRVYHPGNNRDRRYDGHYVSLKIATGRLGGKIKGVA